MYLLTMLAACNFGLGLGKPDTGTAPAILETRIDAITPSSGSFLGGTDVIITGSGFEGEVTVSFGGAQGRVELVDSRRLTVTTPTVNRVVTVDVVVVGDNGADTQTAGFSFVAPESDTGGGGGGGDGGGDTGARARADEEVSRPPLSHAGRVAGIVTLDYTRVLCPMCFADKDTNGVSVSATARFHTPTDGSWLSWIPAEGACAADRVPNVLAMTTIDAGPSISLSSGPASIKLLRASGADGVTYGATDVHPSSFVSGAAYALLVPGGEIEMFSQASVLRAPSQPSVHAPAREGEPLSWEPLSWEPRSWEPRSWEPGAGFMVVTLSGWDGSGRTGSVVCRAPDTGTFQIPASQLARFPPGADVSVALTRYHVGEVTLPASGAILEVVSSAQIVARPTRR